MAALARDTLRVKPESVALGRGEVRMQVVKTKGEVGTDGRLRLDLPVELPAGAVELVLVVGSAPQPNGTKYNFADVAGQLQWKGDALREQRRLRDEW